MTDKQHVRHVTHPPTMEGGAFERDPTGQGEYGPDGLRYTKANERAGTLWKQQEAAGELGSAAGSKFRSIE